MSCSLIGGEQPEVGNSLLTYVSRWRELNVEATDVAGLPEPRGDVFMLWFVFVTCGGQLEVWATLQSESIKSSVVYIKPRPL